MKKLKKIRKMPKIKGVGISKQKTKKLQQLGGRKKFKGLQYLEIYFAPTSRSIFFLVGARQTECTIHRDSVQFNSQIFFCFIPYKQ